MRRASLWRARGIALVDRRRSSPSSRRGAAAAAEDRRGHRRGTRQPLLLRDDPGDHPPPDARRRGVDHLGEFGQLVGGADPRQPARSTSSSSDRAPHQGLWARARIGDWRFVLYLLLLSGFWTEFNQLFITMPEYIRDYTDTDDILERLAGLCGGLGLDGWEMDLRQMHHRRLEDQPRVAGQHRRRGDRALPGPDLGGCSPSGSRSRP